ncbi:transposase [Massilia sp. S19_KUP03_FR1]|uniref:transposase n=1 Tax=Massilia sp. S19_KUP03_FR1 TaxID=3025503 RepID=UPI002FCDBA03
MTRPLRIEFPGALYHVTARGDHRSVIYVDEADRLEWLRVLTKVCTRFNFVIPAYCQMGNHYHLMVETPEGNLSQGMRQLNSVYSLYFNRRHRQVGHVFQGRFKGILVQKESYLLELARYIVLNPVRARCVQSAIEWAWSSYRSTLGMASAPPWLDSDWLLGQFSSVRNDACAAYEKFVANGVNAASPLRCVQYQLLLGDQAFVERFLEPPGPDELIAVCREQRRVAALSLDQYATKFPERDQAMAEAYFSTAFTMVKIADHFHVSYQTVSRAIRRFEKA